MSSLSELTQKMVSKWSSKDKEDFETYRKMDLFKDFSDEQLIYEVDWLLYLSKASMNDQ
jgi:hypothetical protein